MKFLKSIGLIAIVCVLTSASSIPENEEVFENTVCATGTVESAEFGTMTATVCYTGPETGSALAAKHRAAIAQFIAEAQ
jgi:hypothetical protein